MRFSSSFRSWWFLFLFLAAALSGDGFAEHSESLPAGAVTSQCEGIFGEGTEFIPLCDRNGSRIKKEDHKKGIDLMTQLFPNLGQNFVETSFVNGLEMLEGEKKRKVAPIPAGLMLARLDNEAHISAMMAIYFGTIDDKQRDGIVSKVEAERKIEKGKTKEDRRDDTHLALLDRLYWAGKALQGTLVKDPEAQPFLKKFVGEKLDFKSGDFKKIQDQNEVILAKMKEAQDGNTQAKKFLRETLNRDALMASVNHELKNGKPEKAAKLVDAVSWKLNDQSPKFIDMVGPNGGETQRLFLGNSPEEMQTALKAFAPRGFNLALAKEPFESVASEWYADAGGKLVNGVPRGVTSIAKREVDPIEKKEVKEDPKVPKSALTAADVTNLINNNCKTCHATTPRGDSAANFMVNAYDKTVGLRQAIAAVEASDTMKNKVPASVVAQLKAWADGR